MSERWLPIPGYEGLYEVSDQGRVLSHQPPTYRYPQSPRIIGGSVNTNGYPCVQLRDNERRKRHYPIHRLVMLAFVGPCPEGQEVRHLDGDKLNPNLGNLAYGTRAENVQDSIRHGTKSGGSQAKTRCVRGHPFDNENTRTYITPEGGLRRICQACVGVRPQKIPTIPSAQPKRPQIHCIRGHEYTPENTYTDRRGYRTCRECMRWYKRERRRRQREKVAH